MNHVQNFNIRTVTVDVLLKFRTKHLLNELISPLLIIIIIKL